MAISNDLGLGMGHAIEGIYVIPDGMAWRSFLMVGGLGLRSSQRVCASLLSLSERGDSMCEVWIPCMISVVKSLETWGL